MTDAHKQLIYRLGFITLLVLAVYGNTLNHGFVWDDNDIIVNNPLLEKLSNIPGFFLSEDKVVTATGYYRPLTYVSFALDRAIWGLNPLGYNITNLLLHIIVALSFYAVIATLFKKERLAFVAALIFALHPIAVETVNFHAGGRNTLLSAGFALLSLLFYLKGKQLPAIVCFSCAIFSKEFALLLPLVFFFCDRRLQPKKIALGRYLPYVIAIACYLTLRSFAVQKANFLSTFRFSSQLWLTPFLAARYLLAMIFPFQLKVMYDEQTTITVCVCCLLVILFLIAAIYFFRKHREVTFADFWFLLFLLPVVNLIPIPANSLVADRYAYFSSLGFALFLATIICQANKRLAIMCVAVICALYALVDIRQNEVWRDDGTLFTRMSKDAPEMFIGYSNLALYYYNRGDLAGATRNLALACSKADVPPTTLTAAATFFLEAKNPGKAEELLLRSLKRDPANPEPYLLLENIYRQQGKKELADSYLAKGRASIPGFEIERTRMAEDYCRQGDTFSAAGRSAKAANILWRALLVEPDYVPALLASGRLEYRRGESAAAARHLEKALTLDPANISARKYLSLLQQKQGKPATLPIR